MPGRVSGSLNGCLKAVFFKKEGVPLKKWGPLLRGRFLWTMAEFSLKRGFINPGNLRKFQRVCVDT